MQTYAFTATFMGKKVTKHKEGLIDNIMVHCVSSDYLNFKLKELCEIKGNQRGTPLFVYIIWTNHPVCPLTQKHNKSIIYL